MNNRTCLGFPAYTYIFLVYMVWLCYCSVMSRKDFFLVSFLEIVSQSHCGKNSSLDMDSTFLLCPKTIMSAFIALWIMYALYQRSCCRFWRCHQSICKLLRKEWVHKLLWSAGTSFLNSHSLPPFLSLSMFILIITLFFFSYIH